MNWIWADLPMDASNSALSTTTSQSTHSISTLELSHPRLWPICPKWFQIHSKTRHCTNGSVWNCISMAHTHTRLIALCPGLPRWAGTRKEKPVTAGNCWILLKQETVSGSGIHWAIRKSAPRSSQITMPVPHHSVFYRPDALPAAQPTVSKHWRPISMAIDTKRNKCGCLKS